MRVAIIGAGLAGLVAGCDLADAGHTVTIFERRPWAGGKTYSFVEKESGELTDNGQHVFMTCTRAYVEFLQRLGTLGLTKRQRRLRVPVLDPAGRRSDLWSSPMPAPFHLALSFATYKHLGRVEKARVARGLAALMRLSPARRTEIDTGTFGDWLRRHGQTQREITRFWDFIIVPTLNCHSDDASTAPASFVFQEAFLRSPRSAAIGVPAVGLTDLHVTPAIRYVERHRGEIRVSTQVYGLQLDNERVQGLLLKGGERESFDAYVAALPPHQLCELLPAEVRQQPPFAALAHFRYSAILNLHLWYANSVAGFDFAACTGSNLQWIFNRTRIGRANATRHGSNPEHLVISVSDAGQYLQLDKQELRRLFLPELERVLPRCRESPLLRFVAVKEPQATFIPAPGLSRPGAETPFENLFLAGAHTRTGWPATMESAVRSGRTAARMLAAKARVLADRARVEIG